MKKKIKNICTPAHSLSDYLVEVNENTTIRSGVPLPLGAHESQNGVNFSFFSRHATHVRLEFFDNSDDNTPSRIVDFDPVHNRTGDVWHVWIEGVKHGQLYAYRVDGPYNPENGHRFNFKKLLIDPYAVAVSPISDWNFHKAFGYHLLKPDTPSDIDNAGNMPKCIFIKDHFNWYNDKPHKHPWSQTLIYETHVRGLTVHGSANVKNAGTYRGLIEKIPYLKELGITAIELMPVYEFNDTQSTFINPETGKRLTNYWGYDPVCFFAPKGSYCSSGGLGQQILEFKEMVFACHQAGMEVILDVVFNHTAEGDQLGPTWSFRGIDNSICYMLQDDQRLYKNYTGTGNTINANHPIIRGHILDALRYWVIEMHVDGFRFDLASILGLDQSGHLLSKAPLLEGIAEDPILGNVKLIAEAWDVSGVCQLASFPTTRWASWNGNYRDDVRRFWRGDHNTIGAFASRICGSSDIYGYIGKTPKNSINFVTCHDGFTLNDLVSYQTKHNEENGENNRDGTNDNLSCNYGVEGGTSDHAINAIRKRQIKNFLLTLFVSRGVPMLLGGDEFCRTQKGNNNAYCQDNEISWYNWNFLKKHKDIFDFTKMMIAFRKTHPVLSKDEFYSHSEIKWFNSHGHCPDWHNPESKQLACLIGENDVLSQLSCGLILKPIIYLMFNAGHADMEFVLPKLCSGYFWKIIVDTAHASHELSTHTSKDIAENIETYHLKDHSSVILVSQSIHEH